MHEDRVVPSICRTCLAYCPVLVHVQDGRAVKVTGDPTGTPFEGYTCPKGRAMPEQHNDPHRLLHSLRRGADGAFEPIRPQAAMDDVAERVSRIIAEHGPRAVAMYYGNGIMGHYFAMAMGLSFFRAIGSPMVFTPATIDKPGEKISAALHGNWPAGGHAFASSDTWMIVGANPVIAKSNGAPYNNPGRRLKEAVNGGLKLIVIDPRRTETARRAHVHLQARPGEDPTLLAGMIRIIIEERLYDAAFLDENAEGLEALRAAVEPFTCDYVARRAGVPIESLVEAARTFARGKRGGVVCSTGPSFSTRGNLTFYLGLCLNTLCGRWTRAGETIAFPNVLLPAFTPKAQPQAPYPPFGEQAMRVRGLRESASGMPTAALPDEMLLEGEGQVRALFCIGGNPMSAWPDRARTEAALKGLELLVQFDVQMSATAQVATHVIAGPMPLEEAGLTYPVELLKYTGISRGYEMPWAQYTPAILEVPAGSDLIREHEFFFGLAQRMGLQLDWKARKGLGRYTETEGADVLFDMSRPPTIDELWELATQNARVPLEEVKRHPHGALFDVSAVAEPRDPECGERLQIGDPLMMQQLRDIAMERPSGRSGEALFQLVCRRDNRFMNSILVGSAVFSREGRHNPLHMHPADMAALGLEDGMTVEVTSRNATVLAIVEADDSLRRAVVTLSHGFGAMADDEADPQINGTNVNRLIDSHEFDPISGIPRMSAIAVNIRGLPKAFGEPRGTHM